MDNSLNSGNVFGPDVSLSHVVSRKSCLLCNHKNLAISSTCCNSLYFNSCPELCFVQEAGNFAIIRRFPDVCQCSLEEVNFEGSIGIVNQFDFCHKSDSIVAATSV